MKRKRIEYSYRSSPNANRFKLADGGYTVYIGEAAHAGFETFEEAGDYADTIDLPWNNTPVKTPKP